MANHTPGTWTISRNGCYVKHGDDRICTVEPDLYYHGEGRANAQLISAAPDLLEVVGGCLGYFEYMKKQNSDFTPDEAWLKPLREAIEKAEGR